MADPSGNIEIQLQRSHAGLLCTIRSTRPVHAAAVFVGRTPEETVARLPLLFSVCARAQAAACAAALEQALGVPPSANLHHRREAAIATETLREHLWRILLDWPVVLGEPPMREQMAAVLAVSNRLFARIDPAGDLFRPGIVRAPDASWQPADLLPNLVDLVNRHVFGIAPDVWLNRIDDAACFEHWCRATDTPAARLLRAILDADEGALGHSGVRPLPQIPDAQLIGAMTGSDASDLIARPTWLGQVRETSPFTRSCDSALLKSLVTQYGSGLVPRLAAQLIEVATRFALLAGESTAGPGPDLDPDPDPDPALLTASRIGLGRADAARGLLVHLAQVEQGRISDYRILAPTEWNFHPDGVVAQALSALPPGSETALRRQAALLITAIDPCVAYELRLSSTL